jgi:uncharacterized membrane protein YeiH
MKPELLVVLDVLGVISFSVSGALVAIRKNMDYLGVCILGGVASLGGGVMRDILIGRIPPVIFTDPLYVAISFATSSIFFLLCYFDIHKKTSISVNHLFENLFFWFDTVGLASFTVNGVLVGINYHESFFLCCFLGVITGVGGGVLRDLLATKVPDIFVKYVYAAASIIGAVVMMLLRNVNSVAAVVVGLSVIIVVRFLARHFNWNLPKVKN